MKKSAKTIVIIAAGAIAAAAAIGAAYRYSSGFRNWIAGNLDEGSSSSSSPSSDSGDIVKSSDGTLKALVKGGTVFNAATIGTTKSVTFTISPSTATDRNIVVDWADQYGPNIRILDSSGNLLDASATKQTVKSGGTLYFRLDASFSGTETLVAYPEALKSATLSIAFTCYNSVASAALVSAGIYDVSGKSTSYAPTSGRVEAAYADGIAAYRSISLASADPSASATADSAASNAIVIAKGASDYDYALSLTWSLTGADAARLPSFLDGKTVDKDGGYVYGIKNISIDGTAFYAGTGIADLYAYVSPGSSATKPELTVMFKSATSDLGSIPLSFGSLKLYLSTAAYVAPTGVTADNTSVQYS
jgi:hypothetical protein